MFQKLHKLTLSAAILTVVFATDLSVANAMPFLPINSGVETQSIVVLPLQNIEHRRSGVTLTWQFGRDGNRCRSRYGNCRHYYQGYYYETPWWTIPLILGDQIQRQNGGNSHVQWCLSRYHSYSPRTDLWLGYSGRHYRCNSPF